MRKLLFISLLIFFLPFCSNRQGIPIPYGTGATTSFTPPTTNLSAHYDASISSSVHISTGVSQWDDLQNGNNLLQATGSKQPSYTGTGTSSIITFDGLSQYMTAAFTLSQPVTIYIVMKQKTWTLDHTFTDGSGGALMQIFQSNTTPKISLYQAGQTSDNSGLTINTTMVVTSVLNGSSSTLSVNDNTKTTGSLGAASPNGFTIGAAYNGTFPANIGVCEIYIYNAAHSSALQTQIITYLRTKWGI